MRWILDENIPWQVISCLRERGHDVVSVKESMRGAADHTILNRAEAERRVIVTRDKDFGALAYRRSASRGSGVVLLRIRTLSREAEIEHILEVLEGQWEWLGHFSVVSDDRIRVRPLPGRPSERH